MLSRLTPTWTILTSVKLLHLRETRTKEAALYLDEVYFILHCTLLDYTRHLTSVTAASVSAVKAGGPHTITWPLHASQKCNCFPILVNWSPLCWYIWRAYPGGPRDEGPEGGGPGAGGAQEGHPGGGAGRQGRQQGRNISKQVQGRICEGWDLPAPVLVCRVLHSVADGQGEVRVVPHLARCQVDVHKLR